LTLALVDEDAVTAEIELARAVEQIAAGAEYELRELGAYTSALVGDVNVARDTNPLGAAAYARAVWASAQVLPVARRGAFMRRALPLATQLLRRVWAAACTRLEDQGVEPGVHRTVILHAASRPPGDAPLPAAPAASAGAERPPEGDGDGLRWLRDRLAGGVAASAATVPGGPAGLDPAGIEMLARLFDAIALDDSVAPGLQATLARLHGSVIRVAVRDASILHDAAHPVWQLIDALAAGLWRHPLAADPQHGRWLAYAQGLADHILRQSAPDAAVYLWALDRVAAFERHLLATRQQALAGRIAALDRLPEDDLPAAAPGGLADPPLDTGSLPTVPAELYETLPRPAAATEPALLVAGPVGDWHDVFLGGGWRQLQRVWARPGGPWLLSAPDAAAAWALTGGALQRLHAEGLLRRHVPRSLVRSAAHQVRRGLQRKPSA
jgi:hypothetical protein